MSKYYVKLLESSAGFNSAPCVCKKILSQVQEDETGLCFRQLLRYCTSKALLTLVHLSMHIGFTNVLIIRFSSTVSSLLLCDKFLQTVFSRNESHNGFPPPQKNGYFCLVLKMDGLRY